MHRSGDICMEGGSSDLGRAAPADTEPGIKSVYVVARNFFLLLLNCSAWPCLAVA